MSDGPQGRRSADPVVAATVAIAVLAGGGLIAFGATRDTTPDDGPAPATRPLAPGTERAIATTRRAADDERGAADARPDVRSTGPAGPRSDPFSALRSAPTSTETAAARRAASARRSAARARAASRRAEDPAADASDRSGSGIASVAEARRLAAAGVRAKVTLRIATQEGRTSLTRRDVGLLVPDRRDAVARVIAVSPNGGTVTLRLRDGARLTGRQSTGTRCVQRVSASRCRLVRVVAGRTAVIAAPRSAKGRPGPVTALRLLAVYRGRVQVGGL